MALPPHDPGLCAELKERWSALKAERLPWEALWTELASYIMPRKQGNVTSKATPSTTREAKLYDTTAIYANNVLASGQLAWMTPHSGDWFVLQPPEMFSTSEDCKTYYSD